MDIVIDTSVIIAVIANEPIKERLVQITRGNDLMAPASVHWEVANAFSAMLKRKRISLHQALAALELYRQIPLRLVEVELNEALRIAAEANCYAYDAYLLRCAARYNAPLITLDQSLVRQAEQMNLPVIEVIE